MRVNLLPPEIRAARRQGRIVHWIRFASVIGLVVLGAFYGFRTYEVVSLRAQLEDLRAQRAAVEAEREGLGTVAQVRDAALAGAALSAQLLEGDILWSQQLLALAEAVPAGFTLTSVSGQSSGESGAVAGSVAFSATSRDFLPVQSWLIRIASEDRWTNGWVSSVGSGDGGYGVTGSFDLTSMAISDRGRGRI